MKSIDAAGDDESAISTSASDDTCGRSGGVDQTTAYSYGPSGSDADDSLLLAVESPDPTTGDPSTSNEVTYTYNSDGAIATMTDRDGTTHSYEYDDDGNQIADVITKLGAGVDGTVMQRDTTYNDEDQPVDYTTKNAAGDILSQVEETYDGNGDVIAEAQSHDGAVGEDTPSVDYGYQETAGGQERQDSLVYPDGREIALSYGTSGTLTDAEGWVYQIADANSLGEDTLAQYSYMGDGTMVGQSRPQTGANEAITLDNFGDIADLNWTNSADTSTDHYGYGYDADGNVMYKENYVDTADSELYHASGASGGYDGLNRLTSFARGTLSASVDGGTLDTISSPSTTQSWDLDALGNQTEVTANGTEQSRAQNGQNQTTSVTTGDTTNNLTYDANGATTTDEQGRVWTYDAWGDPVSVTSSSGTLLETDAFDALGRRITITTYSGGTPTTTDLYYTTAGQVIEEDQGGEPISQTVYGPNYVNSIIEIDQATGSPGTLNQRIYVQQDANYNVTSVTDTSGTVLERYIYSPYGTVTVLNADGTVKGDGTMASSSYGLPNLYQGMLYDAVTGDYMTPARLYDPMLGTWTSEDPSGYVNGADLYQLEIGSPARSTDPTGLEVEIYIKNVKRAGGLIDVKAGHIEIFVVGDGWYAEFNGGGGVSSGTKETSPFVKDVHGKHLIPSDFGLGDNPTKEAMATALSRIMIKGTPQDRYKNDPEEGYFWMKVVTSNYPSPSAELKALFVSFLKLKQVPYNAFGPNSNTYARALLGHSGFQVADRYGDFTMVGDEDGVTTDVCWDPSKSYQNPKPEKVDAFIGGARRSGSEKVGLTGTIGWDDSSYGGPDYDEWGNPRKPAGPATKPSG